MKSPLHLIALVFFVGTHFALAQNTTLSSGVSGQSVGSNLPSTIVLSLVKA
jgi:hypothetical protein